MWQHVNCEYSELLTTYQIFVQFTQLEPFIKLFIPSIEWSIKSGSKRPKLNTKVSQLELS